MTSNKTTGRNTNQGYLSRQNIPSLKNSLRSQNHNMHKSTNNNNNSKRANDGNNNKNAHNQPNSLPYKPISYISESQQQDSDDQYSFNNRPLPKESRTSNTNNNHKGGKPIPQVNGDKKKQYGQQKDRNNNIKKGLSDKVTKGSSEKVAKGSSEKVSKGLSQKAIQSKLNQQSKRHTKTRSISSHKLFYRGQIVSSNKQQQKLEMLQLLLKQAQYQNQLLREKLDLSQESYQSLNHQYAQLQLNYNHLQDSYNQLHDSFHQLQDSYHHLQDSYNQLQVKYGQSQSQRGSRSSSLQFISQCQQQISRLRTLVKELSEQKSLLQLRQSPNERQQIKDRIIMKLQDELITHKLLLQQTKLINDQANSNRHSALNDITYSYNHSYRHNRSYLQDKHPLLQERQPLQDLTTNRTRFSPSQHKDNKSIYNPTHKLV